MPLSTIFQLYRGGQLTGENQRSAASHGQTLSHNVDRVHLAIDVIRTHNFSGDRHWLHRQL